MAKKYKTKVLIVGAFPPTELAIFGGMVTSCRALLDSTFSQRFDLILIDSTQTSNPPPGIFVRGFIALHRFARFIRKLNTCRPNVVVLFTAVGASVLEKGCMAWISRFFAIPVMIFPRGAELITTASKSTFHRLWISAMLNGATHFLCQGPAWQRFATGVLAFSPDHAPVIPNWTATNRLLAIGEQRAAICEKKIPTILFLGWLERKKGIFELLQACTALSSFYKFRLVIAGKGNAESEVRALVESAHLDGVVEFAGWVQGEDLYALFAASDILALPSWAEGFPNAIIEAMAAKLAVVVSAVGNVPDMIVDGCEALLVSPKDVASLQQAIERLLTDYRARDMLAERGHAFARDNFSAELSVEKFAAAIEAAIRE